MYSTLAQNHRRCSHYTELSGDIINADLWRRRKTIRMQLPYRLRSESVSNCCDQQKKSFIAQSFWCLLQRCFHIYRNDKPRLIKCYLTFSIFHPLAGFFAPRSGPLFRQLCYEEIQEVFLVRMSLQAINLGSICCQDIFAGNINTNQHELHWSTESASYPSLWLCDITALYGHQKTIRLC